MAIEKLFFSGNQKTAMRVAEVRGALIQAATSRGVAVSEYTPAQIKSAAGGWGGADKTAGHHDAAHAHEDRQGHQA